MRAIILDGHLKSALCAVRSLGIKGVEFSVGAQRSTASGMHSKFTRDTFIYTSPLVDKDAFVNQLEKECERLGEMPLVYSFSDATSVAIMRHRDRLSKVATLILSSPEDMDTAFNKAKTVDLAKELGIKTPETFVLNDLDEISELSKTLTYPAVAKPRRTTYWKEGKGYTGEVKIAHTPGNLTGYIAKIFTESDEMPIIQKYIKGDEYGVELLAQKGDVRAVSMHKRIRSMSPSGGASVVKETIGNTPLTELMRESATKLASELNWHGVMMVEFKVDEKSGEPVLIEINGRFWGSLPLAYFAGINFPYMYYELASGKQISSGEHKEGVVSRYLLGDIRHLLRVLFSNDPLRKICYPKRMDAIRDFVTTRNVRYDVIQKDDMKPFLMEIVDILNKATL